MDTSTPAVFSTDSTGAAPAPSAPATEANTPHDDPAAFFETNGFYVLQGGLDQEEVDAINREAVALCRGERGSFSGLIEQEAGLSDEQVISQYLCIHFPHKASALMADVLAHRAIAEVLTRIIGPDVKAMQSMLFIKAAGKPGQAWHQDEDFIPTRDRSLCGGWIALDDATVDNGCLWVIPGSHKPGILWPMEVQDDPRFDCADESQGFPYTDDDAVPVEVKAGSVVFFNGYTLHRSLPNRKTTGFRRALVNHYMSAQSLLPWYYGGKNITGSVAMADNRDVTMVAGQDPYAYKGYNHQIHQPSVRASGEGGCHKGDKVVTKRD